MYRRNLLSSTAALMLPATAFGQSGQTIRLVIPYAPGGATDTSGRILAERLGQVLGGQVVVDNRPGGGTILATEIVAKAKPDGHTLLLAAGVLAINSAFGLKTPYDAVKDLVPITSFVDIPLLLASNVDAPYKNIHEFIAWAKAQTNSITFASAGNGSITHLWAEQLASLTGLKLEHIPYKGSADAMKDVMAGHVSLFSDVLLPAGIQVRNGRLRGLLVSTPKRAPMLPDVPTVLEAGLPAELECTSFFGILASGGTPPALVARLNKAILEVLAAPQVRTRLEELGFIVAGGTPEAYGDRLARETIRFRKIIEERKIPAPA
jgi:tripartite-type tricarboxylate transporter receptor subunit TctC